MLVRRRIEVRVVFSIPGFLPYTASRLVKEARNPLNSLRSKVNYPTRGAVVTQSVIPGVQGSVAVACNRLPHW
jgi:hypothetical protein